MFNGSNNKIEVRSDNQNIHNYQNGSNNIIFTKRNNNNIILNNNNMLSNNNNNRNNNGNKKTINYKGKNISFTLKGNNDAIS